MTAGLGLQEMIMKTFAIVYVLFTVVLVHAAAAEAPRSERINDAKSFEDINNRVSQRLLL